ncbi:MAG: alpha-keto acid decarboxylase family protein [Armatimonadota bacterium]
MEAMTIGAYLIQQLYDHGIRHVFGVPGDYSLILLDELNKSPIEFINTCDEQGAGFAADGYARVGGLGAVCVTYAVGSLKVTNTTAQAFAERSPLVVISGSPGLQERTRHPLLHHLVNEFDTQLNIFRNLTVASATLHDPETACAEIDRVLHAAMRHSRPVYLELPRDMVHSPCRPGHIHQDVPDVSDPDALVEALQETAAMLTAARRPVIVAGVELKRFGLHAELQRFVEQTGIPVAATLQGKSVLCEECSSYMGLYAGAIGLDAVSRYVESSDCLLLLGALLSDVNLGMFTAHLDQGRMITANIEGLSIRHHSYDVRMRDFINGLLELSLPQKNPSEEIPHPHPFEPFTPEPGRPLTVARLIQCLAGIIEDETVVLADIGDAMFGSLDLPIRKHGQFLACPYYSNMGFAIPGSIGVQLRRRDLRPLVLTGDGSFQMTGMELSTTARFGLNPVVVIFNNQGYATERFFLDGPFNDLHPWEYSKIPDVLGAGKGFLVRDEEELDASLRAALDNTAGFSLLDVRLPQGEVSAFLARIGERFGKTVRG